MARRGRRGRSRHARRARRHIDILAQRITQGLLLATIICMSAVIACLVRIGPPPDLRVDALWVRQHEWTVRLLVIALAGAVVAGGPLAVSRRSRPLTMILWLAFIGTCIVFFSDRLIVIHRVLWRYAI